MLKLSILLVQTTVNYHAGRVDVVHTPSVSPPCGVRCLRLGCLRLPAAAARRVVSPPGGDSNPLGQIVDSQSRHRNYSPPASQSVSC